jgi:hypothetical protein
MPLSTYVNDCAVLLNDANFSFTAKNQLVRWINEGREEIAERTGCIRRLIAGQSGFGASAQPNIAIPNAAQPGMIPNPTPAGTIFGAATQIAMQTIPNVERYPYHGFFNPVLKATHAGCESVSDAIAISVSWGGVDRPTLDWLPWDDFQAYCRAYAVLNSSYPAVWSVYNDGEMGEVWMFPIPTQAGDIELDAFCFPTPIYSDSDFDAIPRGFRKGIKFAGAKLAFLASLRYAQAQAMEDEMAKTLGISRVFVDRGKQRSYYPQLFQG